MAEIGIIVHLIGVLHVQVQRVEAELRGQIDPALDALHRHDGVARAVEHRAKGLVFSRFFLKKGLCKGAEYSILIMYIR